MLTRQFGETTSVRGWNLYERPEDHMAKDAGALGAKGCSNLLTKKANVINGVCCGRNGKMCRRGAPRTCSEECASVWMPVSKQCSEWIKKSMPSMYPVTKICEREEYGKYRPGRRKGRCNNADLTEFSRQMSPACCGPRGKACSNPKGVGFNSRNGRLTLPDPKDSNGDKMCSPECGGIIEKFYAEYVSIS